MNITCSFGSGKIAIDYKMWQLNTRGLSTKYPERLHIQLCYFKLLTGWYRRVSKVAAPVTFEISRPKELLLSGSENTKKNMMVNTSTE